MKQWLSRVQARVEPTLRPALEWYRSREQREQRVLILLGATVLALVVFSLIWQPAWQVRAQQINAWRENTRLLMWIQGNESQIRAQRKSATPAQQNGDWIANLSRSAAAANVSMKSFNPEGADAVGIQLENQPFAETLSWLETLRGQGIAVSRAEFVPGSAPGLVNLRATLRRSL